MSNKIAARSRRKVAIRKKVSGVAQKPRLVVFRSNNYIYAQAIDDVTGTVLASASNLKAKAKGNKVDAATKIGTEVGKKLMDKGVAKVVFDRNGYKYHGRVKAVAEGARSAGLEF